MKKKFLMLVLVVLLPMVSKADGVLPPHDGFPTIIHRMSEYEQEYKPKFWLLHVEAEDGRFVNFDYRQAGDTLKMDKEYVRVVCGYEEKDDLYKSDYQHIPDVRPYGSEYADTLYYRQEGDKVYCLLQEEDREILIVDYGLKVGDEFTAANGEVFVVTETCMMGQDRYLDLFFYTFQTKRLRLVSKQTGEEEIWIDGIGSMNWGITPYFLMEKNKVFSKLGIEPSIAQVSIENSWVLYLYPHVNMDKYKAEKSDELWVEDMTEFPTTYEFIADTLCVRGVKTLGKSGGFLYAECLIEDSRIDVMMKFYSAYAKEGEDKRCFEAKIPGFKAGTYQVGMPGEEYVTLKCNGANATYVNGITSSPQKSDFYDLGGRKLSGKPAQGIYIEGGKKKVK